MKKEIAEMYSYDNLPEWVNKEDLSGNGSGKKYATYLVIEDGDYRKVYSDAMEPEDASFRRDLNWIVDEINREKSKE